MTLARFTVPGEPKGKARARTVRSTAGHVRTYTPDQTVVYENAVKLFYREQCRGAYFEGAVELNVIAYYSIPKSASKAKKAEMLSGVIRPTKKPDVDNLIKAIADALNGIAYHDDAQIAAVSCSKYYGEHPRVEIELRDYYDDG